MIIERKDYTQVYKVIVGLDLVKKLPNELIIFFKSKYDEKDTFHYDTTIPLEYQISNKTVKTILTYIYLKYICDSEREKKYLKDKIIKNEIQSPKVKFSTDIFEKRKDKQNDLIEANKDTELLAKYQEPWYIKFKNFVRNLFKRK